MLRQLSFLHLHIPIIILLKPGYIRFGNNHILKNLGVLRPGVGNDVHKDAFVNLSEDGHIPLIADDHAETHVVQPRVRCHRAGIRKMLQAFQAVKDMISHIQRHILAEIGLHSVFDSRQAFPGGGEDFDSHCFLNASRASEMLMVLAPRRRSSSA